MMSSANTRSRRGSAKETDEGSSATISPADDRVGLYTTSHSVQIHEKKLKPLQGRIHALKSLISSRNLESHKQLLQAEKER